MNTSAERLQTSDSDEVMDRVKRIGKEGVQPYLDLLSKHREIILKSLDAALEGFDAAESELSQSEDKTKRLVARQFSSAAEFVRKIKKPLASNQNDEILAEIDRFGSEHQGSLFAMSVIEGVLAGRVSRDIAESDGANNSGRSLNDNNRESKGVSNGESRNSKGPQGLEAGEQAGTYKSGSEFRTDTNERIEPLERELKPSDEPRK